MSKAQTDVAAALRIELDATKAALAKSEGARSALAAELERMVSAPNERAEKAEETCAALTESLAALCKYAHEDRAQTPGFTRLARGILRAEALLASPNPGEGWVSPKAFGRIVAELECPPDVDEVLKEVARLQEAVREDLRGALPCGHPRALLDRSVESGIEFCAGCRNAEMLRDALHMEQTYKTERDEARAERDTLTKQVEALDARAGHFHSCGLELNNATREAAEFKARAEKAERDLGDFFENLDINSLNKALSDTRHERDSLRERLGDAERVIEAARQAFLRDGGFGMPLGTFERGVAALAEFDAKWGGRLGGALAQSPTWPIVLAFAKRMEAKLEKNRHKGDREGWLKDTCDSLLMRLRDETAELSSALEATDVDGHGSAEHVANEAADVANFAMMIADVAADEELKSWRKGGK